jgi:hypothetical protein
MSQILSWVDAPSTGSYTSHEIAPVFKQAVADSLFMSRAKRVPMGSGDTLTIPSLSDVDIPSGSSAVGELTSIPLDLMTVSATTVSLTERARGLMISERNMRRSPIELLMANEEALRDQLRLDLDRVFADAFTSGKLKYVATGAASYDLAVDGTAADTAASPANFYHIRKMRDIAYRDYLMPKINGNFYEFIASTASIRGILSDPEFLAIHAPTQPGMFESNVVGRIADVKIVECNHDNALDDDIETGVGEGVFIAKDAVLFAMLQDPSIRYEWHDHKRFVSLAWVCDLGVGLPNITANAGFARLIHFTSD